MLYLDGLHSLLLEPLWQRCPEPDWQQLEGVLAAAPIPGKWEVYEPISSNLGRRGEWGKYLDLHKQILPCSVLIYKVDPGQNINSSTQTKQHHAESTASLLMSLLWSRWGFEAHSQFKEMSCDDKRELSFLYPYMLSKLPWKLNRFPLLLPQMSVPQAQNSVIPLILCRRSKIKVGGTLFHRSYSQHHPWNSDSCWFSFLSHGLARSETSVLTLGFGMNYELESCLLKMPLLCSRWLTFTVVPHGNKLLTGLCSMGTKIPVEKEGIPVESRLLWDGRWSLTILYIIPGRGGKELKTWNIYWKKQHQPCI